MSAGVTFFFLMNAVAQQPRPASPTSASVQRVADQFMDRLLVKCGDSHFVAFNQYSGYRGVGLFEYKDLSTKLFPHCLRRTASMGTNGVSAVASRQRDVLRRQWSGWQGGTDPWLEFTIWISKHKDALWQGYVKGAGA